MFFSAMILIGITSGLYVRRYVQSKTVVFRLSSPKSDMDYDLLCAVRFLEYQFQKKGYRVLPWREGGEFYFNQSAPASINVFVRGFSFFYDTRMDDKAVDVYYLHRLTSLYFEELRNYDYYLTSQKGLINALKDRQNIGYFGVGAVPHSILESDYKYDVLYIYETPNEMGEFLRTHYNIKAFNGIKFANLSETERQNELKSARLVFYDMDARWGDDVDYIPYAVFDVISYGRPIMTAFKPELEKIGASYLFRSPEDVPQILDRALLEKDNIREAKARALRDRILKKQQLVLPDFKSN